MPESSLALTYDSLRQQIGFDLGYGATIADWGDGENLAIDTALRSGLRQFYSPPQHEQGRPAHDWSFLHPVVTLVAWADVAQSALNTVSGTATDTNANTILTSTLPTFFPTMVGASIAIDGVTGLWPILSYIDPTHIKVAGLVPSLPGTTPTPPRMFSLPTDGNYPLPDEFGGLESELTIESPEIVSNPVQVTAESILRQERLLDTGRSLPTKAAIVPVAPVAAGGASVGTRWQLQLSPIPETNYTLRYRFLVLPEMLSGTNFYPYGGAIHAETILASCLDAGQRRIYKSDSGRGAFFERLRASIAIDLRTGPQRLGFSKGDQVPITRRVDVRLNGVSI